MASSVVHNVRFFDLEPKAAHCLAYSSSRKRLALSRSDTSIEIWNFSSPSAPFLERCISSLATDRSVEALEWAGCSNSDQDGRLFSAGLHGFVIEHNMDLLKPDLMAEADGDGGGGLKRSWPATSGAVWCMKFNKSCGKLAVGTEEGFVCLFKVVSDGLDYDRVLDKQEGRILCLGWHRDGKHIVTGSTDTIRLWNTATGHPIFRMTTGRSEKLRNTIVWSVAIMSDFTIVSGDSRGKTSFWNGKTGTLVDSYQTHKADVLAVAVADDEKAVYSCGVDPVMMYFQPVMKNPDDSRQKWVKSVHRSVNSHDVRAICCIGQRVASVGVDAYLTISDALGQNVVKYAPIPFGKNVVACRRASVVAFRGRQSLHIWKLGRAHHAHNAPLPDSALGNVVPTQDNPSQLIELKAVDVIENFDMSADGRWIGYVTHNRLRVYHLQLEQPQVSRVPVQKRALTPHELLFLRNATSNSDHLLTADRSGCIDCWQLSQDDLRCSPIFRLNADQLQLTAGVSRLAATDNGHYCVLADYDDNVVVVDLVEEEVRSQIPRYDGASVSCLSVNHERDTVVVAYADQHFVECHLKTGKFIKLFCTLDALELRSFMPKQFLSKRFATRGVVIDPKNKDTLIFFDDEHVCSLDKKKLQLESEERQCAKVVKTPSKSVAKAPASTTAGGSIKVTRKYNHLISLELGLEEGYGHVLVAVEVKPDTLRSQLPPSLEQKKFGVM